MENEITKSLESEEKGRKKIMEEVTNHLESYSYRIIELENKIKEYEIEEVKYKNLERENKELTRIYELKLQENAQVLAQKEEENRRLKKDLMSEQTIHSNLKSLLEAIIARCSIEQIADITGLSENKIKEYLI